MQRVDTDIGLKRYAFKFNLSLLVFDRFACKDIELACIQQRTIDHNMVTDSFKVLPEFPDIFSSARLTSIPMSRALALPKPLGRRVLQPGWLLQW